MQMSCQERKEGRKEREEATVQNCKMQLMQFQEKSKKKKKKESLKKKKKKKKKKTFDGSCSGASQ